MDWDGVLFSAARGGHLAALLATLPPARWCVERDPDSGATLLHYACYGDNAAAAATLLKHGLDVHCADQFGDRPAHYAAFGGHPRVLEVLCVAGAAVRAKGEADKEPLDLALQRGHESCARVLIANGARLVPGRYVTPELEAFERGVLRCRAVVVTFLGLKRRRGDVMRALDRWVVRELCFACWSTRMSKEWSAVTRRQACRVQ